MTSKEEEIINIKKKFKEERMQTDLDKKKLLKESSENADRVQLATQKYFNLKKEVDESPLAVLRNELGTKQLEVVDLESKVKTAEAARDDFRARYEQVKKDMVALKKQIDKEKEQTLQRQATELE